ncbi:MAG: transposase [Planctomycetes bacterium]|nr:transposase [Planctomycetota bacterium]
MPWPESRVDARMKFIQEYCSGRWTVVDLAARHGISRKTAHKTLARFRDLGVEGLADESRARHVQDHQTPPQIERRIVAAARAWGCWGPRKLLAVLRRREPDVAWPAKSTVGDILKRHGLVTPRRRPRPSAPSASAPLAPATGPNDVWATDFKGWCLSGARERLEPFVLGDAFSRYALSCTLVDSTSDDAVWPIFERAFRDYGLPWRMRSDNGPPFASPGLAGLSRLSVRWLRLGIRPERITPGKPQQNGQLERFNLTLALEALSPPAPTRAQQERALQRFRVRFNEVRPHEALGDRTPAEVYTPSPRRFSGEIPEFQYASPTVVRHVRRDGCVKWAGTTFFLSQVLAGEPVGLQQVSSRHWSIQLGPLEVALLDEELQRVLPHERLVWLAEDDAHET